MAWIGHKDSVIAVGISPDNKFVATGAMDGVIK
jgi:WD40 repeat protein